jgi:hypothetical protein
MCGVLAATSAWCLAADPPTTPATSPDEIILPPAPGPPFRIEIKSLDEVIAAQAAYHVAHTSVTAEQVRKRFELIGEQVRRTYDGGNVYAHGYVETTQPLTVVYCAVNGGRIDPDSSGTTDTVALHDDAGRLLSYITATPDGGLSYQTQTHGGSASNVIKIARGMRPFHFVFSTGKQ